jgi:hypothetical protein
MMLTFFKCDYNIMCVKSMSSMHLPKKGAEDVLDNSAGLDMESGIREFWTWIEKGSKDHTEAMLEEDTRERNVGTTTVTEDETMIEEGAREGNADAARVTQTEAMGGAGTCETNTVTAAVTGNSANTSKEKGLEPP